MPFDYLYQYENIVTSFISMLIIKLGGSSIHIHEFLEKKKSRPYQFMSYLICFSITILNRNPIKTII